MWTVAGMRKILTPTNCVTKGQKYATLLIGGKIMQDTIENAIIVAIVALFQVRRLEGILAKFLLIYLSRCTI